MDAKNPFAALAAFVTRETPQPLTERFDQWLRSAKPRAVFIYCKTLNLGDKSVTNDERATALKARVAYADGLIELVQRKAEGERYEYLAIKRRVVRPPLCGGVTRVTRNRAGQVYAVRN